MPRLVILMLCCVLGWGNLTFAQQAQFNPSKLESRIRNSRKLLDQRPKVVLDSAEIWLKQARQQGKGQLEAAALFVVGRAQMRLKRTGRGIRTFERAVPLAEAEQDTALMIDLYQSLSQAYFQRKNQEKSLYYSKKFQQLNQQVLVRQKQARLEALQVALEDEQNSSEDIQLEVLQFQMAADSAFQLVDQQEAQLLRQNLALVELQMKITDAERTKMELEKSKMEAENRRVAAELQLERDQVIRQYWIGGSIVVSLLIVGFFLYRHQRLTKEQAVALERERAKRLEQIDRLKDQFLANTSHELRTPLNGIIGLTEGLLDQLKEGSGDNENLGISMADLQTNLGMVVASGRRLASLVNDLLDFSRIRNADLVLRQRPTDLSSIVDVVLQVSYPLTMGKEIELLNEIPAELPAILADEDRLTQILHNLIGNAIKFTERGTVRVQASVKEEMVELSVADTGIGMRPEIQTHIFEAFEQGDGSISREYSGTGLGLSITRFLVERHGGKIWVESEIGKGSTFYMTMPLSKEVALPVAGKTNFSRLTPLMPAIGASPNVSSETELSTITDQEVIHILIVDDESINHQVLRQHLRQPRFKTYSAMNGLEALSLIDEIGSTFDLILLDVMMPRMSGYEVAQKVRETYLPSELPIIMVTAKNQVSDLVRGLNTGANDYLAKPFTKDEFLARLQTHLNLRQINHVTSRFVPTEFIQALGRRDITEVKLGDNTNREISVLFSDIRGYTSLSEQMTPEETFRFVQAYAGRMGPIIQRNQGFVNQYLGDGIMALFQQSPQDALQAAIDMQQAIRAYNLGRKSKQRDVVVVGMGVHTGPLIMGIIGDNQRSDPAVIADTVNVAARLEGLTKYYRASILVSEDTYAGLGEAYRSQCRYLGLAQVKGRRASMEIYECFAGDEATEAGKKRQTQSTFAQALDHYLAADFIEATKGFKLVLTAHAQDKVAQRFLLNAQRYIQEGTPEDWNGIQMMTTK